MRYRPDLDGLRAFAVLAVMASHTGAPVAQGGWMGVDVFFVLSGFLITALLLAERAGTGRVSLARFYARRALRLYPALLLALLLGGLFYRDLGDGGSLTGYGKTAALSALYVQDFAQGLFGRSYGGYGHTWSLGVEEQFYLLWPPVLMWMIARRRDLLRWAASATLASWITMIALVHRDADGIPGASYYLPWCRFSQILLGCCLAILISRGTSPRAIAHPWFGWAAVSVSIGLVIAGGYLGRYPNLVWQAPAIALSTAALVWHLSSHEGALRRILGCRPLAFLGRRSYGIYLFHLPVLEILTAHSPGGRARLALMMIVVTLGLAVVSYRFVELPFLRLKSRLRAPAEDLAAI